jgi:hypothetical protein
MSGQSNHNLDWRDSRWLAIAIGIHLAILAIPARYPEITTVPEPPHLRLKLAHSPFAPEEEAPVTPEPPLEETPPPEVPDEPAPEPPPEPPAEPPPEPKPEPEPELAEEAEVEVPEPLSTARLLYSIANDDWWTEEEPEAEQRRLGVHKPTPLPPNWRKGTGARYFDHSDNTFDGMVVPESVEVLDQWIAADGSRNVVINTPTGHTLCGRAEPSHDPSNPLIEHIMLFRTCGGGGERTFDMQLNRTRDLRDLVDSTTDE